MLVPTLRAGARRRWPVPDRERQPHSGLRSRRPSGQPARLVRALDADMRQIPGVVDTGLFLGTAERVLVGSARWAGGRPAPIRQCSMVEMFPTSGCGDGSRRRIDSSTLPPAPRARGAGSPSRSREARRRSASTGSSRRSRIAAGSSWAQVQVFWGDERCVPPHGPGKQLSHGTRGAARSGADSGGEYSSDPRRSRPGRSCPGIRTHAAGASGRRGLAPAGIGPRSDALGPRSRRSHRVALPGVACAAASRIAGSLAARGPVPPHWRVTLTPIVIRQAARGSALPGDRSRQGSGTPAGARRGSVGRRTADPGHCARPWKRSTGWWIRRPRRGLPAERSRIRLTLPPVGPYS